MTRIHRRITKVKAAKPVAQRGYPRPLLQREDWTSLDGAWQFAIDRDGTKSHDDAVNWTGQITVPFAPETPASGVNETGYFNACWYRRTFDKPKLDGDQRLILHFGAVDYEATVWVNSQLAVRHEGGYTPFSADITDLLIDEDQQTIVVRAEDDPLDLGKPRGKQDWKPEPHSIWYYRTSGIWQSVWMERVNRSHIARLRWECVMEAWQIKLHAHIAGPMRDDLKLRVRLSARGRTLSEDEFLVERGEVARAIALPDPGIDDVRNELLWWPHSPTLIEAELKLVDADGQILDAVASYTAMRSVRIDGDRFIFNGRPLQLRLVLDQGYWPESGLTAPDDDAFRRDVELAKSMGFDGVRMHQKIEDPRFLYWADKLGLFVTEEMPSVYRFSDQSIRRLTQQWMEAIERDVSHPCIVAWVPFNESWGVPDLPVVPAQRHAIQALYHLTRTLDPTRPAIANDGWEAAATDVVGIHDYDADPKHIELRYGGGEEKGVQRLFSSERPGHKALLLDGFSYSGQPIMLTEFGGIAYSKDHAHTWGYSRARSADDLALRYAALLRVVRSLRLFSGFCYTQFTDTYQEANGLLYMDRTPKVPLEQIAVATRGARTKNEHEIEQRWRQQLMRQQEK
jgi:beta-galactosidase/beta-glucuronidase